MKRTNKSVEIHVRCWLEVNGIKFFGPGRVDLLEKIIEFGSISKAAQSMNMSYKKAWGMIEEINALAKTPFVIARKGGHAGGGAKVTQAGILAVRSFKRLNKKISLLVGKESELLKL